MACSSAPSHCGALTCGRQKAERQNAIRLHGSERAEHEFLADACLPHVAQVAKQGQRTELALGKQTLPDLALVRSVATHGRQGHLPGVGRGQLVGRKPLPQRGLRVVDRTRVREEQHVAQTNNTGAVVLGQRVLVELG